MNSNTVKGLVAGLVAGILIGGAPAVADGTDEPISDAYATMAPEPYSGWVTEPCETKRSVDCYWEPMSRTGEWGQAYWRIRVGHKVCVRYWDARYNRTHGHCRRVR
jgi:hypothetical protein